MRFPLQNFKCPAALAVFLLTAIIGLAADLWTKDYAFDKLAIYDQTGQLHSSHIYRFIDGWLHFQVTTNPGAVFGLGEGGRVIFVTVSIAAIAFLFYLFATSGRQRLYQLVIGMLLAGVLGNLYDRIQFGEVRDMIHIFPRWENLFPYIFNVADVLLCTGVGLMVLHMLMTPDQSKPPQDKSKPQPHG